MVRDSIKICKSPSKDNSLEIIMGRNCDNCKARLGWLVRKLPPVSMSMLNSVAPPKVFCSVQCWEMKYNESK